MNLGDILGGIGNAIGGFFNPKKKVIQPTVAPEPVALPFSLKPATTPGIGGVKLPQSLAPVQSTPQPPQLGGITIPHQNPVNPFVATIPTAPQPAQPGLIATAPKPVFNTPIEEEAHQAQAPYLQSVINDGVSSPAAKQAARNELNTRAADQFNSSLVHFVPGIVGGISEAELGGVNDIRQAVTGQPSSIALNDPVSRFIINQPSVGTTQDIGRNSIGGLPIPDAIKNNSAAQTGAGILQAILAIAGAGVPGASEVAPGLRTAETGLEGADEAAQGVRIAQEATAPVEEGPITSSLTTNKEPAITSPNRPTEPATSTEPTQTAISTTEPPTLASPERIPTQPTNAKTTLGGVQSSIAPAIPDAELGGITKAAVSKGLVKSDADSQTVAQQVSDAIDKAAKDAGSSWEKISQKIHAAASNPKIKTYAQAGLTKDEAKVAQQAAAEASFVRDRIDPSLRSEGIQKFYAPKQSLVDDGGELKSQEFDPTLVNENARSKNSPGISADLVDHSTTPYNQYIHRYLNAADAGTSRIKSLVETTGEKDATGAPIPTGAKLSPKAEAEIHQHIQDMVDAHDEATRLTESGDIPGANKAITRADTSISKAINRAGSDIPKNVSGRQGVINGLTDMRGAYNQTLMRTLGFSNVVNRVADQAQKGAIILTNKGIPLANKLAATMLKKAVGEDASLSATGGTARSIANSYAKGTLRSQLNRNLKASVSLAGVGRSPVVKGIAKIDAAIRGAGTYATGGGDLSTEAAKLANMEILGDAQEAGITDRVGMEQYLRDKLGTSEYKDAYNRAEGTMAGYIGLPNAATGTDSVAAKVSGTLSKYVDNAITNGLTKIGVPTRVARELNDTVMPTVSGFAGATSRIGAKAINGIALGIPQINAALKLAKTGLPGATEQAQLMISRSLIDVASTGGVAAAGLLLGSHGHWTGAYPTNDPNEEARWEKDGIPADSFEFDAGDKKIYIQPSRVLGALGIPLSVAAAISSGQDPAAAAADSVNQFVDNLGGSSIVEHITDINNLTHGNDAEKKAAAEKLQESLVPSTGLAGNFANASDPNKRTTNGFVDTLESRLPGARENLPIATDARGNPEPNTKQDSLGSSILEVAPNNTATNPQADPVNSEIERLATVTGADGKKLEITPTTSATNATQKNTQALASSLLNDSIYQKANDDDKAAMLKQVLDGTSTKDISTSISTADQQALLDYKILGSAKAGPWLDDNKNAANYYNADYNNQKANGTLTDADDDITNPSGAKYKAVAATVNQQVGATYGLKQDYSSTSQAEFKALLDPTSDTYDTDKANKIYAYDQARVQAGLPAKYNLVKAEKGSGSSSSFSFANLPTSLIGPGSTSSGSGSQYASNAPLFTPIADLKAPTGTAIPKGRTISVTKGVKV